MSEWKPIETAPADSNTLILVWDCVVHRPRIIRADDLGHEIALSWTKEYSHWMPLSEPPTEDQAMKPEDKDKLMQAQSQKVLDGMKPIWEAHFLNDTPVSGGFTEWLRKGKPKDPKQP